METPTIGTKQIAQYEIRKEIGRGGMSVVYEAEDTRTGQVVALKLLTLPPSLTPEQQNDLIARFRREARAVAQLSHPNIVVIHEVGDGEGAYFLAMERLSGYTLRDRLANGPLTLAQAQPIVTQIAAALDAVHRAGIVHRDVKPSNIMFLPDGTAKLLDFGIARQSEDTTITSTDVIVGSPAYMAPEQVLGERGTAASDVWALGVLAYQMLAGHPPFEGKNIPAVLYQVTHQSPAPTPGLPVAVQKVLRRALDKVPGRRYPTASAFAEDLHAALSPPPTPQTASPAARFPLPVNAWRWAAVLLPVLLGSLWIARLHPHNSGAGPERARLASLRLAAPALPVPAARRPRKAAPVPRHAIRHAIRPAIRPAALASNSPAPPRHRRPGPASPKAVRHTRRGSHAYRRRRSRLPHRPAHHAPRPSRPGYDPQAAGRLQKFIWPEGR